jgi:hypothetical protein
MKDREQCGAALTQDEEFAMAATSNGSDADRTKGLLLSSSILIRKTSAKGCPATTDEIFSAEMVQAFAGPRGT